MDPTEIYCQVRDSFKDIEPNYQVPIPFSFGPTIPEPVKQIETIIEKKETNLPPIYVDAILYQNLNKIKEQFGQNQKLFNQVRLKANPFEEIGNSIFMDRAGIKIANIDAIYNLSGHTGGYLAKQTLGNFVFCDLAGAPGAWTQYFQYRLPESYGYGISLKSDINWNINELDMNRFNITYGQDETGNLYTNALWFPKYVLETEVEGVDLVMSDGGFSVKEQEYKQEFLTSRLILSEILTGLRCLKVGGSFVCKVYDTVTSISGDLLYILACCFSKIWIFKPISSRPANAEKYVVCTDRHESIDLYLNILDEAYTKYQTYIDINQQSENIMIQRLVQSLPQNFVEWLINSNNINTDRQVFYTNRILSLINQQPLEPIPDYNLYKCLIFWNLPDNLIRTRKTDAPLPADNSVAYKTIRTQSFTSQRRSYKPTPQYTRTSAIERRFPSVTNKSTFPDI